MIFGMIMGATFMWLSIRFKPQFVALKKSFETKAEQKLTDLSK